MREMSNCQRGLGTSSQKELGRKPMVSWKPSKDDVLWRRLGLAMSDAAEGSRKVRLRGESLPGHRPLMTSENCDQGTSHR